MTPFRKYTNNSTVSQCTTFFLFVLNLILFNVLSGADKEYSSVGHKVILIIRKDLQLIQKILPHSVKQHNISRYIEVVKISIRWELAPFSLPQKYWHSL